MGLEDDVEDFIKRSAVDDRAAAVLRGEDEKTQRAVLDRGEMSDCTNPSAALMARIRVAKESSGGGSARPRSPPRGSGPMEGAPTQKEIDDFIKDNDIDERAARQLKESSGAVQKNVLDRGGLTDCRNPSAVCLARLRDAKASTAQPTIQQLGLSLSNGHLPTQPM